MQDPLDRLELGGPVVVSRAESSLREVPVHHMVRLLQRRLFRSPTAEAEADAAPTCGCPMQRHLGGDVLGRDLRPDDILEWYVAFWTFQSDDAMQYRHTNATSQVESNPLHSKSIRSTLDEWIFLYYVWSWHHHRPHPHDRASGTSSPSCISMNEPACTEPVPAAAETLAWWWGDEAIRLWDRSDGAKSVSLRFLDAMATKSVAAWPQEVDVCACPATTTPCLRRALYHTRAQTLLWTTCADLCGGSKGALPEWSDAWHLWWTVWMHNMYHWLVRPLTTTAAEGPADRDAAPHPHPLLWEAAFVLWRQLVFDRVAHCRRPSTSAQVPTVTVRDGADLDAPALQRRLETLASSEFSATFTRRLSDWVLAEILPIGLAYRYEKHAPSLRSVYTSELYLRQWAVKDAMGGYAYDMVSKFEFPDYKELCVDREAFPAVYHLTTFSFLFEAAFGVDFATRYCVRDTDIRWTREWAVGVGADMGMFPTRPFVCCMHRQYSVLLHPDVWERLVEQYGPTVPMRWECGRDVCGALLVWMSVVYHWFRGTLDDGLTDVRAWIDMEWTRVVSFRSSSSSPNSRSNADAGSSPPPRRRRRRRRVTIPFPPTINQRE